MEGPVKRFRDAEDVEKDVNYFKTYDKIQIHEDMIRDSYRTQMYRYAMLQNKELFDGKVVIDVGCGTGVLSMFAVQAGARHVYALERSDMAHYATLLVKANAMQDKITIIRGMAEDAELPEKADVIVSEWMGYFLLYESMLDTVLYVRDRWLRPGGVMFPDEANLYMSLLSRPSFHEYRIAWWQKAGAMYQLDLSALEPYAAECYCSEPSVEQVQPEELLSWSHRILHLDLSKCTAAEFRSFRTQFPLQCIASGTLSGIAAWFDVSFPGARHFTLTTSPDCPQGRHTHWRQTMFFIPKPCIVQQDDMVDIDLRVASSAENKRFVEIDMQLTVKDKKLDNCKYIIM